MLEFFNLNQDSGFACLYDTYLTLNSQLIPFVSDAYRVRVAVNVNEQKVYIFKLDKDQAEELENQKMTIFKLGITKSYARICSRELLKFILDKFNLKIDNKFLKFVATFDSLNNSIIIDLKEGR